MPRKQNKRWELDIAVVNGLWIMDNGLENEDLATLALAPALLTVCDLCLGVTRNKLKAEKKHCDSGPINCCVVSLGG